MRIAGGIYRGRKIAEPRTTAVRPTSDKVRQAIFNMLHARFDLDEKVVLDAFCGTGALGLEALSRGAAQAIFIDQSAESLKLARTNATQLGAEAQCHFLKADTCRIGPKPTAYPLADFLFLDPPYRKELVEKSIAALYQEGWLRRDAIIIIEAEKEFAAPQITTAYDLLSEKTYGDTKVLLLKLQP